VIFNKQFLSESVTSIDTIDADRIHRGSIKKRRAEPSGGGV
jgi:hypothetical protein